jgi:hypothetical protein
MEEKEIPSRFASHANPINERPNLSPQTKFEKLERPKLVIPISAYQCEVAQQSESPRAAPHSKQSSPRFSRSNRTSQACSPVIVKFVALKNCLRFVIEYRPFTEARNKICTRFPVCHCSQGKIYIFNTKAGDGTIFILITRFQGRRRSLPYHELAADFDIDLLLLPLSQNSRPNSKPGTAPSTPEAEVANLFLDFITV